MRKTAIVLLLIAAATSAAFAPSAHSGQKDACIKGGCHQDMLKPKFVHGPVAVQDCHFCHRQTGDHKFALVAKVPELCYLCHEQGKNRLAGCGKCHDPHGTDVEFQLKPGAGGKCAK